MRIASLCLALALWLVLPVAASADQGQDRAREAVRAGRILPLEEILKTLRQSYAGDILDVDLDDKPGRRPSYKIKLLTPDGRRLKLRYDAVSGVEIPRRDHDRSHED